MSIWDWVGPAYIGFALLFSLMVVIVTARQRWPTLRRFDTEAVGFGFGAAAAIAGPWTGFGAVGAALVVMVVVVLRWPHLHVPGAALLTTGAGLATSVLAALPIWALSTTLPIVVEVAVWAVFTVGVVSLAPAAGTQFLATEAICRDTWNRPNRAFTPYSRHGPMVSIHVPTYTEPPDMVIGTLESLARLDYDRFEVIVVDNNTQDPDLWRPVKEHCAVLGPRFRFFHEDPLPGAKGGALNHALARTDPRAELVAVVDADHQLDRDFLARLAGHFALDEGLAGIQTPYDFRDWRDRGWLRACYYQYVEWFPTVMASRTERNAAFPLGTMCLLRRTAIEQAGGWSETNVTEDWELGVRMAACGYSTLLFQEPMGTGLIPERHRDFASQRFRWVYGPVQTVKEHWKFLTGRNPSRMTRIQRVTFAHHGIQQFLSAAPLAVSSLVAAVMLASPWLALPVIPWSPPLVSVLAATVIAIPLLKASIMRLIAGFSWRDTAGAGFAQASLVYTCAVASVTGLVTKSTEWRRTNKFTTKTFGIHALKTVRAEIVLGAVFILAGIVGLAAWTGGATILLALALFGQGAQLWAAPLAVVVGDWELSRKPDTNTDPPCPGTKRPGARGW